MTERKPILPLVKRDTPILSKIRGRFGKDGEKIIENQNGLILAFREGVSEGLGVPLEAIGEENSRLWIVAFIKAFISPEHQTKISPKVDEVREIGKYLGFILKDSRSYQGSTISEESSSTQKSSPERNRRDMSVVSSSEE